MSRYESVVQQSENCHQSCQPRSLVSSLSLLTVVQWIDGVYHELEQSVPEVAAGVQDGNVGGSPPRVLARHHARHGRPRHARLEGWHLITRGRGWQLGIRNATFNGRNFHGGKEGLKTTTKMKDNHHIE